MKEITLYYTQGSSDKVYQVRLVEAEGGYNVTYANAARGRALNHKLKTPSPLSLDKAEAVFERQVKAKAKKGYTTNESGIPHSGINMDGSPCDVSEISPVNVEHSGLAPQLLTEITFEDALKFCDDPRYCAQQKHDGERRLLERAEKLRGVNKKGFYTQPTSEILSSAEDISATSFIIDGEDMGQMLWVFDLLEYNGNDIRLRPYRERYAMLTEIIGKTESIKVVETAFTRDEKHDLLERIAAKNLEGIVFKRIDEPYSAGKGGDQYKFKYFYETSVIVTDISDTKRSVSMAVLDDGKKVPVGKVTIPANTHIPSVGDIIEVKYLYAFKGGALFTASFLKHRNDVDDTDCDISRLIFKPDAQAA